MSIKLKHTLYLGLALIATAPLLGGGIITTGRDLTPVRARSVRRASVPVVYERYEANAKNGRQRGAYRVHVSSVNKRDAVNARSRQAMRSAVKSPWTIKNARKQAGKQNRALAKHGSGYDRSQVTQNNVIIASRSNSRLVGPTKVANHWQTSVQHAGSEARMPLSIYFKYYLSLSPSQRASKNKIIEQESDGRWNAVNHGLGNYGRFQMLPQYRINHHMSIREFRTPAGQEKLAKWLLKKAYHNNWNYAGSHHGHIIRW